MNENELRVLIDYDSLAFIANNVPLTHLSEVEKVELFSDGIGIRFYKQYEDAIFVEYNRSVIRIWGGRTANDSARWDNENHTKGNMSINLSQPESEQRAAILHELVELELRKKLRLENSTGFPKDLGQKVAREYEEKYKQNYGKK